MNIPKGFKPKRDLTKKTNDLLEGKIKKISTNIYKRNIEDFTLHETELGGRFFLAGISENPFHGGDFYFNSYLARYGFKKGGIKDIYVTSYAGNPYGILDLVAVKYKDKEKAWRDFSLRVSHKCTDEMKELYPARISYSIHKDNYVFLVWSKNVKKGVDVRFFFKTFHQQFCKNPYTPAIAP